MKSNKKQRRLHSTPGGRPIRRRPVRLAVEWLEDRLTPDTTFHSLINGAFVQDWSNTGQLDANDDWASVPSVVGYLGEGLEKRILSATQVGTRVTVNTDPNPNNNQDSGPNRFIIGQQVTVEGVNVAGYNGTFTIVNKTGDNSFQYETTAGLAAGSGGFAYSTTIKAAPTAALNGDYTRDVNTNQTDPNTFGPRGVTEFELPNPTIALAGDATAAAPYLQVYLSSTGVNNIRVQYTIRDLDSTANDSMQSVALQYRVANISNGIPTFGTYSGVGGQWRPGTWINVPAAYVADATDPNSATRTTNVDVILPSALNNLPFFALRIITTNATGTDEYVGIDDIRVGAAGQLSFSPFYNVSEGGGAAAINVNRTNGSSGTISAVYSVGTTGTATPGVDYTVPPNGTVTFADGVTSAQFLVPVINNGDNVYNINGASSTGNTATITTATNHLFVVGQPVTVAGVTEGGYNGTFVVTAVTGNTFSYTTVGADLAASSGGTASGAEPGSETVPLSLLPSTAAIASITTNLTTLTSTVTTTAPHGFQVGQQVITTGVTRFTASASSAASVGTTATITTTANHLFAVGDSVTVAGVSVGGYNGTFTITAVTANTISYTTAGADIGAGTGGTVTPVADVGPYNDAESGGVGFLITSVPTPTTFTFQIQSRNNNPAGVASPGTGGTARLATAAIIGNPSASTLNINDNDGLGTVQFSASNYTVGEGKGTAILTVVRTGSTVGGLVVTFATSDGSALSIADLDFTAATGNVTFAPGETQRSFTVNIRNDAGLLEGPESFDVNLTSIFGAPGATIGSQSTATVTILEPGQLAINPNAVTISEDGGEATVTVTRVNATPGGGAVTVQYATSNNTATAGSDYVATTGTLSWGDGDTSPRTFAVAITNDTDFAETLSEIINITLANSWSISSATASGTTATITTTAAHGFSPGQQVVIRGTGIPGYNGTYTVATAPTPTTFTFATVAGLASFTSVSGATAAYDDATITTSSGSITIIDNDGQGTLAFSQPTYTIGEGRGPVTLTVTRTGSANGPLEVLWATSDGSAVVGSDYSGASGTLTWANGETAPKSFTVNVSNDASNVEGTESFLVTLSNLNRGLGAPLAILGTPNPATVDIIEPGQIQLSANAYTTTELNGATNQVTVTVNRVNGATGPVTVQYTTSNGSATSGVGNDYLAGTGSLSWAAGDIAPKTFTVDVLDDSTPEAAETFNIALNLGYRISAASQVGTTVTITTTAPHDFVVGQVADVSGVSVGGYNGRFLITAVTATTFTYEASAGQGPGTGGFATTTIGATGGSPTSATVTILDNDSLGTIELSSATYTLAEDATGPITITVNRTGDTTGTVTVVYNVTGGTATLGQDYAGTYTGASGTPGNNQLNRTLTFGPGVTSQTFQIRPVDDNVVEGNETVNIVLSNVLGGGTLGAISSAVLTITDAEPGKAEFASSTYTIAENGGNLTVTVNRVGGTAGTLTVPYSTINGTAVAGQDFTAVTGTLTWLPGDASPRTFVVPVIGDSVPETNETFLVSLGQTGLGDGSGAAPVPVIWYNFDATGDNPTDGYIFDQGPNALDLRTFQRNGRTPVSGFVLAPEQLNTSSGVVSYRSASGATFPGAGEAFLLEGGLSRSYEPFGPQGVVTSVNGDRFSGLQLAPGPRGSTITGSTFADNRLNSGNNNSGYSSVTYSFWLQLPELVGADFNPTRYGQGNNRTTLIGRSSDPGTVDGGVGGDFGGQVAVRTIENYRLDPGYNPADLPGTVKYTFELRANQQFGSFGSGGFAATNTTFKVGEWNHFAISYTPTETRIYKNGVLSETLPIGTLDLGKNAIEEIEGWLRLNQVAFNGASIQEQGTFNIDDLGVWTQQLSAADVMELYTRGIGAAVANVATVTITDVPQTGLTVSSFQQTATGFKVRFTRPIDTTTFNLYDQTVGAPAAADLQLLDGGNTPVNGSVVYDADNSGFTFIRTGGFSGGSGASIFNNFGTLAAGSYTVRLFSRTDGVKAGNNGELLDGNTDGIPGGDYVNTFTVTAPAADTVTVGISDFTRGYGQVVDVPANGAGIPITISRAAGVSAVDFVLSFNSTLLNVTGFTLDSALSGASSTFTILEPGRVRVQVTNSGEFGTSTSALRLGTFTANVPETAPYASKHILDINSVTVLDSSPGLNPLPILDDDGIHVAAYLSDTNPGTQRNYSSADIILVQRMIGTLITGFSAYQNADPLLIADVNASGTLSSTDIIVLQRVIGTIPVTQIEPLPGVPAPAPNGGPDPRLFIPQDLIGIQGQALAVPVRIEVTEPTGIVLAGGDIVVNYDPAVLNAPTTATLAPELSDPSVGFNTPSISVPTPGVAIISTSTPSLAGLPLAFGQFQTLFTLNFTVRSTASNGSSVIGLRANQAGTFTALINPELQNLLLVPAPTNADTDPVDGRVLIGNTVVESVVVNQNTDAVYQQQRSQVTHVTVTFSARVSFVNNSPNDAFQVTRREDGAIIGVLASPGIDATGTKTVVTLTFQGPSIVAGSLADGSYQLAVLGNRIIGVASGQAVDADGNGTAGGTLLFGDDQATEAFFRRYGDVDGDRDVDLLVLIDTSGPSPYVTYGDDFGSLSAALNSRRGDANYLSFLDYNGDGFIDANDLATYRIDVVRSIVQTS